MNNKFNLIFTTLIFLLLFSCGLERQKSTTPHISKISTKDSYYTIYNDPIVYNDDNNKIYHFLENYRVKEFKSTNDWPGLRITEEGGYYLQRIEYDSIENKYYIYVPIRTCLYGMDLLYTYNPDLGVFTVYNLYDIAIAYDLSISEKKDMNYSEIRDIELSSNSIKKIISNHNLKNIDPVSESISEKNEIIKIIQYIEDILNKDK